MWVSLMFSCLILNLHKYQTEESLSLLPVLLVFVRYTCCVRHWWHLAFTLLHAKGDKPNGHRNRVDCMFKSGLNELWVPLKIYCGFIRIRLMLLGESRIKWKMMSIQYDDCCLQYDHCWFSSSTKPVLVGSRFHKRFTESMLNIDLSNDKKP